MPIYEYQCADCHHQFDVLQKISDASPEQCPECSKGHIIRLVSAAGFQLKGSGWYATDFKNKGKPEAASTSEKPSTDAKPSVTKTTDASTTSSVSKKGESD